MEASLPTEAFTKVGDAIELWLPVSDVKLSKPTLDFFLERTPEWLAGYFTEGTVLEKVDVDVMAKDGWLVLKLRD
jgi:hypothetical protein